MKVTNIVIFDLLSRLQPRRCEHVLCFRCQEFHHNSAPMRPSRAGRGGCFPTALCRIPFSALIQVRNRHLYGSSYHLSPDIVNISQAPNPHGASAAALPSQPPNESRILNLANRSAPQARDLPAHRSSPRRHPRAHSQPTLPVPALPTPLNGSRAALVANLEDLYGVCDLPGVDSVHSCAILDHETGDSADGNGSGHFWRRCVDGHEHPEGSRSVYASGRTEVGAGEAGSGDTLAERD